MHSQSEENYLKAIYVIGHLQQEVVSTNSIAHRLETKASSVTDMLKKLAEKKLVHYKKYQGVTLTNKGLKIAANIIRKHRLWEVFLLEVLEFKWDEVHEIAEQLEHIQSKELTKRLDRFLGHPKFDPHGDPIPDENGKITKRQSAILIGDLKEGESGVIHGVKDSSVQFLKYLENQQLIIGKRVKVLEKYAYDGSLVLSISGKKEKIGVSSKVVNNLVVLKK